MNTISYLLYRIQEKIFVKLHLFRAFKTSCGLKHFNMNLLVRIPPSENDKYCVLSPEELYLGIDYLTDENTLLDTPLSKSPHYDLVCKMNNNEDISECEYIKRWRKGTLDWRYGFRKPKNYNFFVNKFNDSKKNIIEGKNKPSLVYKVGEKYYIFDGKHRAAMCLLNNIDVPCYIIDRTTMFSNVWLFLLEMIKHDKNYSKHKKIFDAYMSQEV